MTLSSESAAKIRSLGPLRQYIVIPATSALATAAEIVVDTKCPNQHFRVRRLRLQQDSGTAATWNYRLSGTTGFADAAAFVVGRSTDTELSTALPINDSLAEDDGWLIADATGKIYIKITFGSATNHVLSGSILLEAIDLIVAT